MRLSLVCAVAFATAIASQAVAQTGAFDMRDCPLDRVTFVDPWAGGTFEVQRVGTDYNYRCESDWADEPIKGEFCSTFGQTILDGLLLAYEDINGDDPEPVYAVFYVEPAAPCCGWLLENRHELDQAAVTWLEGSEVPLLGDMSFASIEPSEDEGVLDSKGRKLSFGNEKIAMACRAD